MGLDGEIERKVRLRARKVSLLVLLVCLGVLAVCVSSTPDYDAENPPTQGLSSDPVVAPDGTEDYDFHLFKVHKFNVEDLDAENKNMHLQSPDHIFRLSLRPGHKVISKLQTYNMKPPGIAADWPAAMSIINAFCEKKNGDACEVQIDITDTLWVDKVKFRQVAQQHQLRVEYFDYNKFYFIFENKSAEEVIVTFSNVCPKCGREKHRPNQFIQAEHVQKKLGLLRQITTSLNHLSLLGVKSKAMVHQFTKNMTTAETRLLNLAMVEAVALLCVAAWQVWKIKRLVVRNTIL